MRNDQNQTYNRLMKIAKRIALTVLCCVPFMILFGYYTRNVITANWAIMLIFISFMAVVVLIEEFVSRRRAQKREARALLENTTDVFK